MLDHDTVQEVWEKGAEARNNDKNRWRKDVCGAWMGRQDYLNRNSQYGWEIVRIDASMGDDVDNLRPVQWQNAVSMGESDGDCVATADGTKNVGPA